MIIKMVLKVKTMKIMAVMMILKVINRMTRVTMITTTKTRRKKKVTTNKPKVPGRSTGRIWICRTLSKCYSVD